MKLNRKLVLIMALLISVVMSTTGTIAYLTSTDSQVNVMTLGKVEIEQIEQERVTDAQGNVTLQNFTQGKPAYPVVEVAEGTSPTVPQLIGEKTYDMFNHANVIDKIVTVKNTGKSEAYIRTFVAIEAPDYDPKNYIHAEVNRDLFPSLSWEPIEIDGVEYLWHEFLYADALPAGETSAPSLMQVYLDKDADNADVEPFGDTWDILVLSQAVQTAGFGSAEEAFEAAFPMVEGALESWLGGMTPVNTVNTIEELQKALDAATDGTTIVLGADMSGYVTVTQKEDVKLTIEGMNHKFDGAITVDGKSSRFETAGVTIKNINFDAGDDGITYDAFIRLGSKENTNNQRYTNNVTVANCTFTGDGIVAVKSYTGGDYNTTITGCTVNEYMHSLGQLDNIEKNLTVTNCYVYSKNGLSVNHSPSLKMSNCTFNVKGYAVRFGDSGAVSAEPKTFEIKGGELKSACEDGDAVIMFRGSGVNAVLTLDDVKLEGTSEISGNTAQTVINGLNKE